MLLRELENAHHLQRVLLEQITPFRKKLSVTDKKGLQLGLIAADEGQKAEERTCPVGRASGDKLFGDALCYSKNVATMLVVIAHECFASKLAISLRVVETLRHLLLHVEMKNFRRTFGRVMQVSANTQEKIISRFQAPPFRLAQPIL